MKSSIFLSDLTVIDHAYINDKGQVIGGSFNPGFIITGEVDAVEKVVVDFSTIKKDVKGLIDRHVNDINDNGFDHKLWIIEGYSNCTITLDDQGDHHHIITTPAVTLVLPIDAIKFIPKLIYQFEPTYDIDYIGYAFELYVERELEKKYPGININVECFNNTHVHKINQSYPLEYFTYSHGLKDSTSYGCQNIAHGHLSFIQHEDLWMVDNIAEDLDGAVFINRDNVISDTNDDITIAYRSARGAFFANYKKDQNKIIVLPTETTIEYIAEYIKNKYGITDFYVSEGLSKGTYV